MISSYNRSFAVWRLLAHVMSYKKFFVVNFFSLRWFDVSEKSLSEVVMLSTVL